MAPGASPGSRLPECLLAVKVHQVSSSYTGCSKQEPVALWGINIDQPGQGTSKRTTQLMSQASCQSRPTHWKAQTSTEESHAVNIEQNCNQEAFVCVWSQKVLIGNLKIKSQESWVSGFEESSHHRIMFQCLWLWGVLCRTCIGRVGLGLKRPQIICTPLSRIKEEPMRSQWGANATEVAVPPPWTTKRRKKSRSSHGSLALSYNAQPLSRMRMKIWMKMIQVDRFWWFWLEGVDWCELCVCSTPVVRSQILPVLPLSTAYGLPACHTKTFFCQRRQVWMASSYLRLGSTARLHLPKKTCDLWQ